VQTFELLQQAVTAARELRADHKLDPKARLEATLSRTDFGQDELLAIERLANLKIEQRPRSVGPQHGVIRSTSHFDLQIHAAASGGRARLLKEIADLERAVAQKELRLNDPNFNARAPESVRNKEREAYVAYKAQLQKNKALLEGME
jgi:valyl-tRNA synthetase